MSSSMTDKPDLARQPNAKARPLSVGYGEDICGEYAHIYGYQQFRLYSSGNPIPDSHRLDMQQAILGRYMTREHLEGKSFLDLGANAGFWSFLAASQGAVSVFAVEQDIDYFNAMLELCDWSNIQHYGQATPVQEFCIEHDVVHALGLLHWLYNCTASYGSLDAILGHFASLTKERLHVEWIAPEDPMIQDFGHLDWHPDVPRETYDEAHFQEALFKHFSKAERLGEHTPTRHIWVAWK